ncbi:hypothetical protein NL351_28660, partial [Klebsiella pneumoniae]|nr:hypothetical protein [Klebsiella pneumoniae]
HLQISSVEEGVLSETHVPKVKAFVVVVFSNRASKMENFTFVGRAAFPSTRRFCSPSLHESEYGDSGSVKMGVGASFP